MPDKCGKCSDVFQPAEYVAKCVDCKLSFHPACTRAGSLEKFTKAKTKNWKCDLCKGDTSSVKSNDDVMDDRKFLLEALSSIKEEINLNINTKFNEVNGQLNSMSNDIKSLNKKLAIIEAEQNEMIERCHTMKQAQDQLSANMMDLTQRQREFEQHSRCCNLEITGLPVTNNENIYALLEKTAKAIGVPFKKEDISIAHRLRLYSRRHTFPPLIVQFVSRGVREAWRTAARRHRNLIATNIDSSLERSSVFINEQLTPHNKALLGRARRLLREKKLVFAGFFNGKVLVKKREGDAAERVLEPQDLDKFV